MSFVKLPFPQLSVADQTSFLRGTSGNIISPALRETVLGKQAVLDKRRKARSSLTKNTVPEFPSEYLESTKYLQLQQLSIQSLCCSLPSPAPPGCKETQRDIQQLKTKRAVLHGNAGTGEAVKIAGPSSLVSCLRPQPYTRCFRGGRKRSILCCMSF